MRVFVNPDSSLSEVLVDNPANPLGLPIIDVDLGDHPPHLARWVDGTVSFMPDDTADAARDRRDALMRETDWMVLPDSPISDADREKVLAYRQALRDVPAQPGFPVDIAWPVLEIAHAMR